MSVYANNTLPRLYDDQMIANLISMFDVEARSIKVQRDVMLEQDMQLTEVLIGGSLYYFYAEDFVPKTLRGVLELIQNFVSKDDLKLVKAEDPLSQQYQVSDGKSITTKPHEPEWHQFQYFDEPYHIFLIQSGVRNEN